MKNTIKVSTRASITLETTGSIGEARLTTDAGTGITQSFYLDEFQIGMLSTACEQVANMMAKRRESLEKFQQESRAAA